MPEASADVSIIIPTFDSDRTISKCLDSVQNQTHDSIEIIVVDGGSSDDTCEIVSNYDVTLLETGSGRTRARVEGAKVASAPYLLHIDSDMELPDNLVARCLSEAAEGADAALISERNVGSTIWAEATDIGKSVTRTKQVGFLRFVDTAIYEQVGKHNPDLVGREDQDLHNRVVSAGANIVYIDEEIQHHLGEISFFDLLRKRAYYQKTALIHIDRTNNADRGPRSHQPTANYISSKEILKEEINRRPVAVFLFLLLWAVTFIITFYYKNIYYRIYGVPDLES